MRSILDAEERFDVLPNDAAAVARFVRIHARGRA
jgi:hypothetical protein